ncbi:DUF1425 domain-containing protein [uncultured Parasutterella sp.]|jgi:Protein of unknown function (DUF1425).|uniref:DUF1425 domain-containing protein n=1 Tax=uncultured Parasutterella sp. TaxID=1263098 RepID=UPI002592D222|nr:DUF1425 domain-containing protein [uncultured Parasutterella sp.]
MKNISRQIVLVLSLSAVLGLSACATQEPPQPVALEDTSVSGLTIIYGTEPLARSVGFLGGKVYQDGSLKRMSGSIKNLTQATFPVEYQVTWHDVNGAPLPNASSWTRVTLNPRAQKPISSFAKGTEGQSAVLTFKVPADVEIFIPEPDPVEVMRYQQEQAARNAAQ